VALYLIDTAERLGYINEEGTVNYDGPHAVQPFVNDVFEEKAAPSDALDELVFELPEEFPIVEAGQRPAGAFPPENVPGS